MCGGSERYDGRVDVYSFGMIMYIIITGDERPYGVDDSLNHRHITELLPKVPVQGYADIMRKCWNKNIHKRPRFDSISKDLRKLLFDVSAQM